MKDISYEILDLFRQYGSSPEGIRKALDSQSGPEVLHALSDIRENLLEWLDYTGCGEVLQIGSGYGVLTGLLASRCAHVAVMDEADENLAVNQERNKTYTNITYGYKAGDETGQPEPSFDLVVMAGLRKGQEIQDAAAFGASFLKQEGRLVIACENALGLRYLAGADHEEGFCTRKQAEEACREAGLARADFYYPVPDHRMPISLYSDRYLPGKGDITSPSVSYDGPRYACLNEGEVYDRLIEEDDFGRFANSFLIIASKDGRQEKTIFAKYNRTRKEEFRIRTTMGELDGERRVEKAALESAGRYHILSLKNKCRQLRQLNPRVRILEPEISADGSKVEFGFLEGITLAERLGRCIRDGRAPVEEIKAALQFLYDVAEDQIVPFAVTPEFTRTFGPVPDIDDVSYKVSNIDGLFENLMITEKDGDEKLYCLDYEWVFDFPVPARFVQYRNLAYFYYKYQGLMSYAGLEEFLQEFGIGSEMASVYASMEDAFQSYVHGDAVQGYLVNYQQKVTTLSELKETDQALSQAKDRISQLQAEVEEKNLQIRKEQEVQRLTNNHVANLEVMIKDLRHEIDELGKLATYLTGHEALVFKARRKLGAQVNKAFPRGTRKRKILNYCFNTVKHPVRYGRLYATKEGRNQIEGDFKIGEDYLKYGRLVFPSVPGKGGYMDSGSGETWDGPMVSIVIPCYNQVHYTYACLQSILEFTKDVTYEVIIADDVSTDATAELGRYAEGLVICRNETNQGFLRNCNQAAKAARGKYIMFLNNDTKVTEGWLSSLVNLIAPLAWWVPSWCTRTDACRKQEALSGAMVPAGTTAVWMIRTRRNIIM